jgi:surfeit locus 1 family protein
MARLWLVTAAALLGVFVTVSLGFWQLSRAADKVALQQTIDARQRLSALDGSALLGEGDAAQSLYRSVVLRGSWLGGHTVFLDNRQMNGKPGFFVVTPLQLERSGRVVLVQRGWSARSFTDRSAVPDLPTPAGVVELQGRIAPPPSKLYEFEASQAGLIRQNLDLQQFAREIGRPLVTVSVLQTGPPGDGLLRDWPRVNLGVDKHYGYAFQWFALGGLITLLYGWFQVVKRFVAAR